MIITAFRNFNVYNIFLLLILTFLLRVNFLLESDPGFSGPYAIPLLPDSRLNALVTGLIVFFQGILLNRSITSHNLFNKTSYLPALLYVVLASMFQPFLSFNAILICNFFLLWLIDRILFLYRGANVLRITFDMGLAVGTGSLLYPPFLLVFPVTWFSLMIFRPFSWREWIAPITGVLVPYILAFTWSLYRNDPALFPELWRPLRWDLQAALTIPPHDLVALIPLFILLGLAFNQMRQNYFKNVVLVRKSQLSLALISILLLLIYLLSPRSPLSHFMMLAPPFAVFLAYYFITARVRWFYELLFALLLGSIFYFQFV